MDGRVAVGVPDARTEEVVAMMMLADDDGSVA